jgi:hypothetical protein
MQGTLANIVIRLFATFSSFRIPIYRAACCNTLVYDSGMWRCCLHVSDGTISMLYHKSYPSPPMPVLGCTVVVRSQWVVLSHYSQMIRCTQPWPQQTVRKPCTVTYMLPALRPACVYLISPTAACSIHHKAMQPSHQPSRMPDLANAAA